MKSVIIGFIFAFTSVAFGDATLTIVNQQGPNDASINMDGSYLCTAGSLSSCTSPVSTGLHQLQAVFSDGQTTNNTYEFSDGDQVTWTIGEVPASQ